MRLKKTMAAILAAASLTCLAACGGVGPATPQADASTRRNTVKSMGYLANSVHMWGNFCGGANGSDVRSNKLAPLRNGYYESDDDYYCDYSSPNPTNAAGTDGSVEARMAVVKDALPPQPNPPTTVKGLDDLKDSAAWYAATMHEAGILVDKTRLVSVTVNPDRTLTATVSSDLLGRFAAWPDEDDWTDRVWSHKDKLVEYKDVRLTAVLNHSGTKVLKLKGNRGRYEWYLGPNVYGKPKTADASMFSPTGREKRHVSYAPTLTAKANKVLTRGFYLCQLLGSDGDMASGCEALQDRYDAWGNSRPVNQEDRDQVSRWLDSAVRYSFTQAPQWHATVKANTSK